MTESLDWMDLLEKQVLLVLPDRMVTSDLQDPQEILDHLEIQDLVVQRDHQDLLEKLERLVSVYLRHMARILVQVRIYRRLWIGRDGHLDISGPWSNPSHYTRSRHVSFFFTTVFNPHFYSIIN